MAQKHAPLTPTTPGYSITSRWRCGACGAEGTWQELDAKACTFRLAPIEPTDTPLEPNPELEPTVVTDRTKIN